MAKTKRRTSRTRVKRSDTPWRKFWIAFGYFSAVVGVAAMVFGVGSYWGDRKARKKEFKTFAEYLHTLREGVRISEISCGEKELRLGQRLQISLKITNATPYDCELWIGADAIHSSGLRVWNVDEDRRVQVPARGLALAERSLTFPVDAELGSYDLAVVVWYGKVGDPTQSERISRADIADCITVRPRAEEHIESMPGAQGSRLRPGTGNENDGSDEK